MRWIACLALACAGCFLGANKDGESCESNEDCESEHCEGRICTQSACRNDSSCEPGWECVRHDGDPIFGGGAGNFCHQTCVVDSDCPPLWGCAIDQCSFRGPEVVIVASPEKPQRGQAVHVTIALEPPEPDLRYTYTVNFSTAGDGDFLMMGSGPDFDMVFDEIGQVSI